VLTETSQCDILDSMKQTTWNLDLTLKKPCKQMSLEKMEQVVRWVDLIAIVAPHYPEGKRGPPPFPLMTMLRTHFMQQWFTLSDLAMEEALFDTPPYREFAKLEEFTRLPDQSTILRFRHRLEERKLAEQLLITGNELVATKGLLLNAGTVVDATLIATPTFTKNKDKKRRSEIDSSKKGNQWYFGVKAHIGAVDDSGMVHTVRGTSVPVSDIAEGNTLLHGHEPVAFGDVGYQGIEKRADATLDVTWHVAMRPCKRKALDIDDEAHAMIDKAEKLKEGIHAKVEHPFRVIKRRFRLVWVRFRGLKKNTGQLVTLFALSYLWRVRGKLMVAQG
jgi:IS5 family transposase